MTDLRALNGQDADAGIPSGEASGELGARAKEGPGRQHTRPDDARVRGTSESNDTSRHDTSMVASAKTSVLNDVELVRSILDRLASDLAMIIDRPIVVRSIAAERSAKRVEGKGRIHVSFKLGFRIGSEARQGCVLIPLPDAVSLATYLMMVPDEVVNTHRSETTLERAVKDAMLEVGNSIACATDAAVRNHHPEGVFVRSEGCQGVRANVRPALLYEEGSTLVVGRAQAQIHTYPAFELILMLPLLES